MTNLNYIPKMKSIEEREKTRFTAGLQNLADAVEDAEALPDILAIAKKLQTQVIELKQALRATNPCHPALED